MDQYKTCNKCKQVKPLDAFNKRSRSHDGLEPSCRDCVNAQKRAWNKANPEKVCAMNRRSYQKNPEVFKANASNWAKNNWKKAYSYRKGYLAANPGLANSYSSRRRTLQKNSELFFIRTRFLMRLYSSACVYCAGTEAIEADHVIPISRGGRHSEGNLVPACRSCNRSKHNKLVVEWRLKR